MDADSGINGFVAYEQQQPQVIILIFAIVFILYSRVMYLWYNLMVASFYYNHWIMKLGDSIKSVSRLRYVHDKVY